MSEYYNFVTSIKYNMGLIFKFLSILTFVFVWVPMSYAQAITLQNAVEGELYTESTHPELYCLAMNIYFEAKSEPVAGQYAVADVVLNRVNDARYPNSICKVVLQGPVRESWKTKQDPDLPESERIYLPKRNMCQFSWWCDGKSDEPKDETGWAQAQYVAGAIMYSGKYRGITEGATHYHATYVKPSWAKTKTRTTRIEKHIFYRWEK